MATLGMRAYFKQSKEEKKKFDENWEKIFGKKHDKNNKKTNRKDNV